MKKIGISLFILGFNFLFAQSFDGMVGRILENNQELKAIRSMNRLEVLQAKNEMLPENPELEHEFKENNNYEIGVTQSFRFPTFYYHQYKNLQLTRAQQKAVFAAARLRILEEAGEYLHRLAYLNSQITVQKERLEKASRLLRYFEKQLAQGESTQLAVNEAKIYRIGYENRLSDLLAQMNEVKHHLKVLNGGISLSSGFQSMRSVSAELDTSDLKADYLINNPALALEAVNQQIAARNTKIARQSWLPDFQIGVHREKETGPLLHYGISLPLWKNKNKCDRAKAARNYHESNQLHIQQSISSQIDRLLEEYRLLKIKYNTNLKLQQSLNSEELLLKSMQLGEISVIDYFTELEKLYSFEDDLRKTKRDLQIVKVKLTSFRF